MTALAVKRDRVTPPLPHRLFHVALGAVIGTIDLSPALVDAQTSCDPASVDVCVPPGWEDPLAADCAIWETGYVIVAPPDACLPPLGPGYP
jgi:hypothetical protein